MNTNTVSLRIGPAFALAALIVAVTAFTGCDTMPQGKPTPVQATEQHAASTSIVLREGDVVKISFPGSPNLDTVQPIRRDGKLNLPLIGEMDAAGMTPGALQDKLVAAYASQISSKEVIVQVQQSTFPVYVTGAVMHAGKVLSDHPLTALDAVMEAGGPNYDAADLKRVRIVRNNGGKMEHYIVDLKSVLVENDPKTFYLQPGDIVYVPERFTPF